MEGWWHKENNHRIKREEQRGLLRRYKSPLLKDRRKEKEKIKKKHLIFYESCS
jgi:hypothetical protein